jgi:hypothetical protein
MIFHDRENTSLCFLTICAASVEGQVSAGEQTFIEIQPKLACIHSCGIAEGLSQAVQQCAGNFHHVGFRG